ncbi:MAG TPA: hypothetical protein VHP11_10005 [Tepidisphaeraceae bacterium]|nr:hypothetical protein [Tepidisphaeraceae bacterium]
MSDADVDLTRGVYRRIYSGATRGRRINSVSPLAELLFWRLHLVADDFGAFEADPYLIQCSALPLRRTITEGQIADALGELAGARLVELYQVHGEAYGRIVGFEDFQPAPRNGRRIKRYPLPDGDSGGIQVNPGEDKQSAPPIPIPIPIPKPTPIPTPTLTPAAAESAAKAMEPQSVSEDMQRIYDAYPRKVGKAAALKAIAKALAIIKTRPNKPADPVRWLLERVESFAKSPAGQQGKYTPHPATWFNQGRYDDDSNEWNSNNAKTAANQHPSNATGREFAEDLRL